MAKKKSPFTGLALSGFCMQVSLLYQAAVPLYEGLSVMAEDAHTEEEKQIFDAACSDYQYPLGTPVMVGKRGTSDGVDYIYQVESRGATSTIYVTVPNEEGAKPEFTRVVR